MTKTKTEVTILLKCLIAMAASDGVLHEKEVDVILEIMTKVVGVVITVQTVNDAYNDLEGLGENSIFEIIKNSRDQLSDEMKEFIIKASYMIMISDGTIVEPETGRLSAIAALLQIEEDRFSRLIRNAARAPH